MLGKDEILLCVLGKSDVCWEIIKVHLERHRTVLTPCMYLGIGFHLSNKKILTPNVLGNFSTLNVYWEFFDSCK